MRHGIVILIFLITGTDSFGQFKPKGKTREFKTDTLDIFASSKKEFYKDKASFQSDNNKVRLLYTLDYDNPCCVDDEVTSCLTITFENWDKVELNKDYNVTDFKANFTEIVFLGGEYNKPNGRIRLIKKTKRTLTFSLDITVQSTDKTFFLIFKGDLVFKRDN